MTNKRPRGRPPGTGKKDGPHLAKIADLIIARHIKHPTTAMRAYIMQTAKWPESDATLIRRWQEKWKSQGEELLKAARKRAEPVSHPVKSVRYSGDPAFHLSPNRYGLPQDTPLDLQSIYGRPSLGVGGTYLSFMEQVTEHERKLRDSVFGLGRPSVSGSLASVFDPTATDIMAGGIYAAAQGGIDSVFDAARGYVDDPFQRELERQRELTQSFYALK